MITAKAIGGPRDGVKLTADLDWPGRIRLPDARDSDMTIRAFYPGVYYYAYEHGAWMWLQGRIRRVGGYYPKDQRNWELVFDA